MTSKNFIIKNGLTIGTTEVVDSSGDLTTAAFGSAALEAIDDQVNTLLTAGTGVSLSYDDSAGTLTINGQQGDITGVNAGAGLTGTASSGDATLNIGAGTGITVNADDIAINFKDEDNMASNSDVHAATQQSIKAYVDASVAAKDNTDEITEGSSNLYYTNERVDDRVNALIVAGTGITSTYDDAAGTLTLNGQVGDVTSVVAGTGLTGGGTSGDVTVNVIAGNGLISNADNITIDTSITADLTTGQELTNKTITTPIINGTVSGTAILDQDNMASNSNTHLATQQSIKAYVDSSVAGKDNTDEITEGSSNLYFTNERVDDRVDALLTAGVNVAMTYDDANGSLEIRVPYENIQDTVGAQIATNGSHTGLTASYDDSNDGAIDLAVSTSHVRGLISAGGDLSYDNSTGVISFTNDAGDISSVVAGTGMTGGGTAGDVTVNVIGGDGITANANDIALSSSVAGNGLSFSSGVLAVGVDDSSIELDSDAVQVKALGITNAMLAGSIAEGKLAGSISNAKLANSSITIDGSAVALGGSITTNNTQLTQENVEDFVGGMLDGTETGISVSYDDTNGNLDFVIGDNDITNDMLAGSINQSKLAGSIANAKLANSTITIDGQSVALGGSVTTTNTQLSTENVEDIVGAMFDGNTETGLSVAYDDASNDINVVVDDSTFALTGDVTGTATQTAKGDVSIATTLRALTFSELPSISIGNLSDVDISGAQTGQVLGYNASNQWVPVDQSTGSDQVTEGTNNRYFSDNRVAEVFQLESDGATRLNKGIKLSYDAKTSGVLDGEVDVEALVSNGIGLNGNNIELDYTVITDSDLSGGLPSGSGKEIGHLFFLI